MPDFNKGDFTQQGVAGHVNANLRLNEKRLVNIDMTSNEEAEGCTIAGTVTDLLNDKVYNIGSGGGGGGDLPFCTVTVVNDQSSEVGIDSIDPETFLFQFPATQPAATCDCLGVYGLSETLEGYVLCNPFNIYTTEEPGIGCTVSDVTDLVNLEWAEVNEGFGMVKVIDTSKPASCTINYSVWHAS